MPPGTRSLPQARDIFLPLVGFCSILYSSVFFSEVFPSYAFHASNEGPFAPYLFIGDEESALTLHQSGHGLDVNE